MNHSVGSYRRYVKEGKTRIFSLRDVRNHPLATIELDGHKNVVQQVKAHSDAKPNKKMREYISEWLKSIGATMALDGQTENITWSEYPYELSDAIFDETYGTYHKYEDATDEDYDLPYDTLELEQDPADMDYNNVIDSVDMYLDQAYKSNRITFDNKHYDYNDVAKTLIQCLIDHDMSYLKQMPSNLSRHISKQMAVFAAIEKYKEIYDEFCDLYDIEGPGHEDYLSQNNALFKWWFDFVKNLAKESLKELAPQYNKFIEWSDKHDNQKSLSFGSYINKIFDYKETPWANILSEKDQPRLFSDKTLYDKVNHWYDPSGYDEHGYKYSGRKK